MRIWGPETTNLYCTFTYYANTETKSTNWTKWIVYEIYILFNLHQNNNLSPVISILQVLYVSCLDNLSSSMPLSCGVPKGSGTHSLHHVYYSTQLTHQPNVCLSQVTSFSPHAAQAALDSLYITLAATSQWMASYFLTPNPSKTEFLIISLPTQLSKLHMPNLKLPDNSSFTTWNQPKILVSSSTFTFSSTSTYLICHNLSKACYYHIRDLRHIRTTLHLDTASTIATSLVHCKLDYCNNLYYKLPESQLKRLQAIQNSVAHCVTSSSRFQHNTFSKISSLS
jgi:hypothetical protein